MRFTYSYGYRTRDAAEAALEDCFSSGEVSHGDSPRVEVYATQDGKTRFRITLAG
jgi:hypothetical protein